MLTCSKVDMQQSLCDSWLVKKVVTETQWNRQKSTGAEGPLGARAARSRVARRQVGAAAGARIGGWAR